MKVLKKRQKNIITTLILITSMVFSVGCDSIGDNFSGGLGIDEKLILEQDINCVRNIEKDKKPGWFERNPIPIHISNSFSNGKINEMLEAINYLNSLEAGLTLEPKVESEFLFYDFKKTAFDQGENKIIILYDDDHTFTWPSKYEYNQKGEKKLVTNAVIGGAIIRKGALYGDPGIEGAVAYHETSFIDTSTNPSDPTVYYEEEENKSANIIEEKKTKNSLSFIGGSVYLLPEHRDYTTTTSVFIHEVLHILGFGHIDDKSAIMYPVANPHSPNNVLSDDEKQMLKELYPPGDVYENVFYNGEHKALDHICNQITSNKD